MSSQGNGEPILYDVRMSQQIRADVVQLHAQAMQAGTGEHFLATFREVIRRLRTAPMEFGEPLYHLPILHLLVRQAVLTPLVVDYAVHEVQPLVFIRGFKVLS